MGMKVAQFSVAEVWVRYEISCCNKVLCIRANERVKATDVVWVQPVLIVIVIPAGQREPTSSKIIRIHNTAEGHLLFVIDALYAAGLFFAPGEGRQQHGSEDSNDRDDNQQLDQGKAIRVFATAIGFSLTHK